MLPSHWEMDCLHTGTWVVWFYNGPETEPSKFFRCRCLSFVLGTTNSHEREWEKLWDLLFPLHCIWREIHIVTRAHTNSTMICLYLFAKEALNIFNRSWFSYVNDETWPAAVSSKVGFFFREKSFLLESRRGDQNGTSANKGNER